MLVLSRMAGEQIVFGKDITITVIRIYGGRVRIGIEAPPETRIMRREILEDGEDAFDDGKTRVMEIGSESRDPT